jgi:hypothetical protein
MLTAGPRGGVVGVAVGPEVGVGDGDSVGTGEVVGAGIRVGVTDTTTEVFSGIVVGEGPGVTWAFVLHARVNKAANKIAGNLMA